MAWCHSFGLFWYFLVHTFFPSYSKNAYIHPSHSPRLHRVCIRTCNAWGKIRFKSYFIVLNSTMIFSPRIFWRIYQTRSRFLPHSHLVRRGGWLQLTIHGSFTKMLNVTTCFQFPVLEKIAFPGKKTFGNLERNVVEKRQKESPQHPHYRFYHFLSWIF